MRSIYLKSAKRCIWASMLFIAIVLGQMPFESCSDNRPFSEPGCEDGTENVARKVAVDFGIEIDSQAATRSGRQLWSRAARQQVNDLRVYAFKGEGQFAIFYESFTSDVFENRTANYTQTENLRIEGDFEEGTYTFLVMGLESELTPEEVYDEEHGKNVSVLRRTNNTYRITEPEIGVTTLNEMTISLTGEKVDEAFVGIKEGVQIGSGNKVVNGGTIILNRLVAGLLAYFTNIPYYLPDPDTGEMTRVTKIILSAFFEGTTARLSSPPEPIAIKMNKDGTRRTILSFDLTPFKKASDSNHYEIPANDWRAEGYSEAPKGVKKLPDSVLGGLFRMPTGQCMIRLTSEEAKDLGMDCQFDISISAAPFIVELLGGENNLIPLKKYLVECTDHTIINGEDTDFSPLSPEVEYCVKGTGLTPNAPETGVSERYEWDEEDDVFNIYAISFQPNHYYSMGVKYTDSGDAPTDPEHPEPFEEDKPLDLSKEQILTITVSPLWDKRHDLTF